MNSKLVKLLALLLSVGVFEFASSVAHAGDHKLESKSKKEVEEHGHEHDNRCSQITNQKCTGELVTACGVQVVVTTCGGTLPANCKNESDDNGEHHSEIDIANGNKGDCERNREMHASHADHSNADNANDRKIAICHRMGGSETSMVVSQDGWANGHSRHPLDTVGRCDEDLSCENPSLSDVGYAMNLSKAQIACLNTAYNKSNVTITLQPARYAPSRGGARTVR